MGPGAIVIGGYVNGLGLVRALAARGVPTVVVTTKPYDFAHLSRCASGVDVAYGIDERPEVLVELLEHRASRWAGWMLLPTGDAALGALGAHHDRLSSRYRVVAPPAEATRYFLDKDEMHELARSVGADVPHRYGPATQSTAELADLRFPVVVKPLVGYRFLSRFRRKLFVARDREELRDGIARMREAGIAGQVLDLVPGPDSLTYLYSTYIDARGEPLGGITVRKVRQNPPGFGVARVAEIVPDVPSLHEITVELLRRIGFRGIAEAEFKRDPRDGRYRFLEVNGRPVAYNSLLTRAGYDTGWLAWTDHVTGNAKPPSTNGWPGAWIHLHADIRCSALPRRDERLTIEDFLAPYRRPTIEAVWSARDPRPFIAQWSRSARAVASALWQSTHQAPAPEARTPRSRTVKQSTAPPRVRTCRAETTQPPPPASIAAVRGLRSPGPSPSILRPE